MITVLKEIKQLLEDILIELKKQPHDEIAKLRCEVAVNTSELNNIKRKLSSN